MRRLLVHQFGPIHIHRFVDRAGLGSTVVLENFHHQNSIARANGSKAFTEERSMICILGRASTNSGSRINLLHERSSSNEKAGSSLTLVSDTIENLLDLF